MGELELYFKARDNLSKKLSELSADLDWDGISKLRDKKGHVAEGNKINISTTNDNVLSVFILAIYSKTEKVLIYNGKSRKRYFVPYYKIRQ